MARMRQGALPHEKNKQISGAEDTAEAKQPAASREENAQRSQSQHKPKQSKHSRPARRSRAGGDPPQAQPGSAPREAPEVIVNKEKNKTRDSVPENKPSRPVIESSVVRVDALLAEGDNK